MKEKELLAELVKAEKAASSGVVQAEHEAGKELSEAQKRKVAVLELAENQARERDLYETRRGLAAIDEEEAVAEKLGLKEAARIENEGAKRIDRAVNYVTGLVEGVGE